MRTDFDECGALCSADTLLCKSGRRYREQGVCNRREGGVHWDEKVELEFRKYIQLITNPGLLRAWKLRLLLWESHLRSVYHHQTDSCDQQSKSRLKSKIMEHTCREQSM